MKIFHNSQDSAYRMPFGAVPTGGSVRLRLDVCSGEQPNEVTLRLWLHGREELILMECPSCTGETYVYEASLTVPTEPCLVWYYFIVDTKEGRTLYVNNGDGLGGVGESIAGDCGKSYQITVYDKNFRTPDWFCGEVMYQIFPDRFFGVHENGEIYKKRNEYIIHYDRGEPIAFNPHPFENGPACNDFYGGNLQGIIKKLPYIKSLGVGVIYLNPIFDAYSNHKYDTADYKKIDPMFGDENDFSELCREAEKLGIRIILDGVFSHTGADSVYFNKYGSYGDSGAYRDESSPYRSWYCFGDGNSYESWWGCSNLPNVNELEPSYLDYILRDEDSVIKKWLRLGASGWRLDVADELPDEFIKLLRSEVKKTKPDAVIIGEVWEDASNKTAYDKQREYLLGDELDSVMNYPFRDNVTDFIMGGISAAELNRRLMSIAENYPVPVLYSLMNLIGTHDTIRAKSLFGGLAPDCGMMRLSSGMEELATYRMICAVFMQMTFVGVPSIYYGDEAGMQGGRDPFNRQPFPWRAMDIELLNECRLLGAFRKSLGALRRGFFKTLYAENGVLAYARYFNKGKDVFCGKGDGSFALCAVNRGFEPITLRLDISEFEYPRLVEGLENPTPVTVTDGIVTLDIPPVGYCAVYSA